MLQLSVIQWKYNCTAVSNCLTRILFLLCFASLEFSSNTYLQQIILLPSYHMTQVLHFFFNRSFSCQFLLDIFSIQLLFKIVLFANFSNVSIQQLTFLNVQPPSHIIAQKNHNTLRS